MPLKSVYLLMRRLLGLVVLLSRGDRAKDAELWCFGPILVALQPAAILVTMALPSGASAPPEPAFQSCVDGLAHVTPAASSGLRM